ncbi:MAG: hypothetical protein Q8S73_41195 [Deltaproteobacteria bacterium]|nr:hypothetical protein [Myxococcales bacterium]MDP3220577.1 hypothetical protein [Deltaproteobacteria bacterium]
MQTPMAPAPDLRIVYDDTHRRRTPHAPADWQLTDEGLRDHVAALATRADLLADVRRHGEHQGEAYLQLAARRLVAIDWSEVSRVVREPRRLSLATALTTVGRWARFGAELRAMRSGVAA